MASTRLDLQKRGAAIVLIVTMRGEVQRGQSVVRAEADQRGDAQVAVSPVSRRMKKKIVDRSRGACDMAYGGNFQARFAVATHESKPHAGAH